MTFEFPKEIKDLFGALGDATRWKILESIINNENNQSYTELRKAVDVSEDKKGSFNYHLKELQKAGWLRHFAKNGDDAHERQKSFYSISKFGLDVIEDALNVLNRRSRIEIPFVEPLATIDIGKLSFHTDVTKSTEDVKLFTTDLLGTGTTLATNLKIYSLGNIVSTDATLKEESVDTMLEPEYEVGKEPVLLTTRRKRNRANL